MSLPEEGVQNIWFHNEKGPFWDCYHLISGATKAEPPKMTENTQRFVWEEAVKIYWSEAPML